jgi:hypothetical protein
MTEELEQLLKNLQLRRMLEIYDEPLLSKTGRNLATRVANGGFACPELEF